MKIIQIFMWSIIVTLTFVYAVIFQWTLNPPTVRIAKVTVVAPSSTNQIPEQVEKKKEGVWALRWKDESGEIVLATSTQNIWRGKVRSAQYQKNDKNYIFFFRGEYEKSRYQLALFDVNSKKVSTIFDPQTSIYPKQVTVINDTLFFSFEAYGGIYGYGGFFYVDLSEPVLHINEIKDVGGKRVINEWSHYWILESYGDANGGYEIYQLFDPDSKEVDETKHGRASDPGERLLGVTKDNTAILLSSEGKVITYKLSDKENSEVLFDFGATPSSTRSVYFKENDDDLYLVGEDVWVYDFDTKQTNKIPLLKTLSGFEIISFLEEKVCLLKVGWEGDLFVDERAIWNMTDNSVEYSDITSCESKAEDKSIKAQPLLPEGLPPQLEVVEI